MKHILAYFALFAFSLELHSAVLYGVVKQPNGSNYVGQVSFVPLTAPVAIPPDMVGAFTNRVTTSSDGAFTNSLAAGEYDIAIGVTKKFRISVPEGVSTNEWLTLIITNASWAHSQALLVNSTNYTLLYPTNFFAVNSNSLNAAVTLGSLSHTHTALTNTSVWSPTVYLDANEGGAIKGSYNGVLGETQIRASTTNSVLEMLASGGGPLTTLYTTNQILAPATADARYVMQSGPATNITGIGGDFSDTTIRQPIIYLDSTLGGSIKGANNGTPGLLQLRSTSADGILEVLDSGGHPFTNLYTTNQILAPAVADFRYVRQNNKATNVDLILPTWDGNQFSEAATNIAGWVTTAEPAIALAALGIGGGGTNSGIFQVATVADLQVLSPSSATNVILLGYSTINDGGGGLFVYNGAITAGAGTTNRGTAFKASDGKVWQRADAAYSTWRPEWFGAIPSVTTSSPTDDHAPLIHEATTNLLAEHRGGVLHFSSGVYSLRSRIYISENYSMVTWEGETFSPASGGWMSRTVLACYDPSSTNSVALNGYGMLRNICFRKCDNVDYGGLAMGRLDGSPQANRYSFLDGVEFRDWNDSATQPAFTFYNAYGLNARHCQWSNNTFAWAIGGDNDVDVNAWFCTVQFDNCIVDMSDNTGPFPSDDDGPFFALVGVGDSGAGNKGFWWNGGAIQSTAAGLKFYRVLNTVLADMVCEQWDDASYGIKFDRCQYVTVRNISGGGPFGSALLLTNLYSFPLTFEQVAITSTNGVQVAPAAAALGAPLSFTDCDFGTTPIVTLWTNSNINIYPYKVVNNGYTKLYNKNGYMTMSQSANYDYAFTTESPSQHNGDLLLGNSTLYTGLSTTPADLKFLSTSNYIKGTGSQRMFHYTTNSTLVGQAGQVDFQYSNGTTDNEPTMRVEVLTGMQTMFPGGTHSLPRALGVAYTGTHPLHFAYNIDPYLYSHSTYKYMYGIGPARAVSKSGTYRYGAHWWVSGGAATTNETDMPGGDLYLSGGVSTGSGTSEVYIKAAGGGSSGATDTIPTDRLIASSTGIDIMDALRTPTLTVTNATTVGSLNAITGVYTAALVATNTATCGGNNLMRWRGVVGAGDGAPASLIGGDMYLSNVTVYVSDGTNSIPLN